MEQTAIGKKQFIGYKNGIQVIKTFTTVLILLYLFLVGVSVLSGSFKLLGGDFANSLLGITSNPFIALFSGMFATVLFQSSSVTTSIVVGFVAGGALPLHGAIPMIMGANLGTSVTNSIVSLGFAKNRKQFSRAIAAATIHDFFNILTVFVLLPIEIFTGILEKSSIYLSNLLSGGSAVSYQSPIKAAIKPLSKAIISFVKSITLAESAGFFLVLIAAVIIIFSLSMIVKTTKTIVESNRGEILENLLTKNVYLSILFGTFLTIAVQSSSITTSLLVPMAGSGLLSLNSVFPVTVGANIGTTTTALLAALAGNPAGLAIALVHFLFNVLGMVIWFIHPKARMVPLWLASKLADLSGQNRLIGLGYVVGVFFILPMALMFIFS